MRLDTLQCNPIDSSLDSLVNMAVILHDGQPPAGGEEACMNALASAGEKERFEACRDVMERLAGLRRQGWEKVQHARQVAVLGNMDSRRTSARNPKLGMHALVSLKEIVSKCDKLADEARRCFAELVDAAWTDEYLATRIEPLRDELEQISATAAAWE